MTDPYLTDDEPTVRIFVPHIQKEKPVQVADIILVMLFGLLMWGVPATYIAAHIL